MSSLTFARIETHELETTAQLLANAFADNPCYAYIHPRSRTRSAELVRFFSRNLRWRLPLGLTWVARDGLGGVLATASLEPPGGIKRPALDQLTHWVLPSLHRPGVRSLVRLVRVDGAFAEQNRLAARAPGYWHVHAVAVDPSRQGQRVGTSLVAAILEELQAKLRRNQEPTVLSTQRERNVRFYAQLGFELNHERTMMQSRAEPGFHSWFMRLAS